MRSRPCFSGTTKRQRRTAKGRTVIGASWRIRRIGRQGRGGLQRAAAVPGRDQRFAGNLAWRKFNRHPGGRGTAAAHAVAVFRRTVARGLLPERLDRSVLRLNELRLCRPRQWGGMLVGAEACGASLSSIVFWGRTAGRRAAKSLPPRRRGANAGWGTGCCCWLADLPAGWRRASRVAVASEEWF